MLVGLILMTAMLISMDLVQIEERKKELKRQEERLEALG